MYHKLLGEHALLEKDELTELEVELVTLEELLRAATV